MNVDWQKLTQLTGGEPMIIEKVRLVSSGISIEGSFELPPLAALESEDQVFIAAFVRCHGSIKQMEEYFGISYPTVKNRLNKISEKLDFVKIEPSDSGSTVLDELDAGEISVKEALRRLGK